MQQSKQKNFSVYPAEPKTVTVIIFIDKKPLPLKYRNVKNDDKGLNSLVESVRKRFGPVHHLNKYDAKTGLFMCQLCYT